MPWNQPGSGGNDPWGQRGAGGGGGQQQGPPDLDEIVRRAQRAIGGLLGGRGGGSGGSGGGGAGKFGGVLGIGLAVVVAGGLWLASGFYIVEAGEEGVVLRFGRYAETTQPGLRWHVPRPVEQVHVINVQRLNTVEVGYRGSEAARPSTTVPREALMLTSDENIIDIRFAVQFDIKDPRALLFNVSEDMTSLVRGATESAVREVVGRSTLDFVLTEGRREAVIEIRTLLQEILDRYDTGIRVRAVEMQNAQPPAEVKDAFDDAVRAREDEERLKNEAEAYANDVIPRARGQAARIMEEAEGYSASVMARAEGEAERFIAVLDEYRLAPGVTRERLYIETMESVFANTNKLMLDQSGGGNNVIYLPIDQLMRQGRESQARSTTGGGPTGMDSQVFTGEIDRSTGGREVSRTPRAQ